MLLVSGSTRTVRCLADSWQDHLGILLTPFNRNSMRAVVATGLRWACDNGCYSGFDECRFRRMVCRSKGLPRLLWIVCPDAVANARRTLELWDQWSADVRSHGVPVAFVLQDGQEDLHLPPEADCYFVGGSNRFKLSQTAADLCREGKRRGKWVHMGRVNSLRRMTAAYDMGCDSVDGSSMSMFGDKYIHRFCRWNKSLDSQPTLFTED